MTFVVGRKIQKQRNYIRWIMEENDECIFTFFICKSFYEMEKWAISSLYEIYKNCKWDDSLHIWKNKDNWCYLLFLYENMLSCVICVRLTKIDEK